LGNWSGDKGRVEAVSNTTVISNFAAIGEVDVLRRVYGQLFIPTHVYEEVRDGAEGAYRFLEIVHQVLDPPVAGGWLRLIGLEHQDEIRFFRECPDGLHAGEASCIAIARRRGWLLLTDDRAHLALSSKRWSGMWHRWTWPTSGSVG
jgi:predicted nucleic acid-binding protein